MEAQLSSKFVRPFEYKKKQEIPGVRDLEPQFFSFYRVPRTRDEARAFSVSALAVILNPFFLAAAIADCAFVLSCRYVQNDIFPLKITEVTGYKR